MNREELTKKMKSEDIPRFSDEERKQILYDWMKYRVDETGRTYGEEQLIIGMEECAELQKEISKYIRQYNSCFDTTGLLEESADVLISLISTQLVCGLDNDDIWKVVDIKLQQLSKIMKDNLSINFPYKDIHTIPGVGNHELMELHELEEIGIHKYPNRVFEKTRKISNTLIFLHDGWFISVVLDTYGDLIATSIYNLKEDVDKIRFYLEQLDDIEKGYEKARFVLSKSNRIFYIDQTEEGDNLYESLKKMGISNPKTKRFCKKFVYYHPLPIYPHDYTRMGMLDYQRKVIPNIHRISKDPTLTHLISKIYHNDKSGEFYVPTVLEEIFHIIWVLRKK